MKKRAFLSILFFVAAFVLADAQTVSVADALSKAASLNSSNRHRVSSTNGVSQAPELVYTKTDNGNTLFYVFNYPQGGFAIIGGDECATEILGYSTNGEFNIDSIPEGLKDMLGMYSSQISYAIDHPVSTLTASAAKAMRKVTAKSAIKPLMTTSWGQDEPFNNAIPSLGDGYAKLLTGCNATAAAQVMKYYNYPTHGEGSSTPYSKSWNTSSGTITLKFEADFANTTYDWANMLDDYTGSYSDAQAKAVATLLYHVGVGMDMDYGQEDSGSRTTGPGSALTQYFKYSKAAKFEHREYYSDEDWEDLIYAELAKGHPIIYGGQSSSGGHAFVCHGYDATKGGYLMNWGWKGYCDGYYPLTGTDALQPSGSGTGGAGDDAAYTISQCAYIGLIPDPEGDDVYLPQIAIYNEIPFSSDNSYTMTLDRSAGSSSEKTVSLASVAFYNVGYLPSTIKYGLMFEEQSTGRIYYSASQNSERTFSVGDIFGSFPLSFNTTSIPCNGTYTIRPVVRNSTSNSDDDWQLAYVPNTYTLPTIIVSGGEDFDPRKVYFTISKSDLRVGETATIIYTDKYDGKVSYVSDATSVVTVDENGNIEAVGEGTATITVTATATENFDAGSKTFIVNVTADKFIFTETPYFNKANLVSTDEYKIHCAVKNNTSSILTTPGVYYMFQAEKDGCIYTRGSGIYYYSIGSQGTAEFDFDFSDYLNLFIPNTSYTVYFYSDSSRTVPMNIPSLTFTYCTPGDADGNGTVNVSDISSIKNIIVGTNTASDIKCNSDLNYDGKVDVQDITILVKKLKGN